MSRAIKDVMKHGVRFFENLANPRIGHHIQRNLYSRLLTRADGRPVSALLETQGFEARWPRHRLLQTRYDDLESFQNFNGDGIDCAKPGYSACSTPLELKYFLDSNALLTKEHNLLGFCGQAFSLGQVKCDAGMEISQYDGECESIAIDRVPIEQFVYAIAAEHRELFYADILVPNALAAHCDEVPKDIKLSDVLTNVSTLKWLMSNDCEEKAELVAEIIYRSNPNLLARDKREARDFDLERLLEPESILTLS